MTARDGYAISWREDDGPRHVGSLELGPHELRLTGRAQSEVRYGDVLEVTTRRLDGRRVVALLLSGGRQLVIASLDRAGSLGELERELRARVAYP